MGQRKGTAEANINHSHCASIRKPLRGDRKKTTLWKIGKRLRDATRHIPIAKNQGILGMISCLFETIKLPMVANPTFFKAKQIEVEKLTSVFQTGVKEQQKQVIFDNSKSTIKPSEGRNSCRQPADVDLDGALENDPAVTTEYIQDIFKYLRIMEGKYPIQKGFLDDHEITPQMRAILVDWLVEIHFHFNMHQETLHLCVSIVDRYLQETKVMERDVFQLVGASALLVAAKYERTYIPRVYEFKSKLPNPAWIENPELIVMKINKDLNKI
nr:G2/mitotic-specific cyclin-B2-like [Leptinotarsa decemlineata]